MVKHYPLVPDLLKLFLSYFLTGDILDTWAQNLIKSMRPCSGILPCQLGLAAQLDHQFGSKWLIDRLHRLKICESYMELQNYKWSVIRNIAMKELVGNPHTLQRVHREGSQGADVTQQVEERRHAIQDVNDEQGSSQDESSVS